MVVDVFVAERDPVDALGEQLLEPVFDEWLAAVVAEARGERPCEAALVVDLAQQQAAAVAGEEAAGEIDVDLTAP